VKCQGCLRYSETQQMSFITGNTIWIVRSRSKCSCLETRDHYSIYTRTRTVTYPPKQPLQGTIPIQTDEQIQFVWDIQEHQRGVLLDLAVFWNATFRQNPYLFKHIFYFTGLDVLLEKVCFESGYTSPICAFKPSNGSISHG
jgi:hypothetical protein